MNCCACMAVSDIFSIASEQLFHLRPAVSIVKVIFWINLIEICYIF